MLNVNCLFANSQKVIKGVLDTRTLRFNSSVNKPLIRRKGDELKCTQVRYKSTPPGATPVDPKAIPYVNHNLRPDSNSGTAKLLLAIPIITFGLGTWQVKRLKWKTELIKNMEERKNKETVPLPLNPKELAQLEFQKVTVTGHFDHENEIFYGPKPCLMDGEVKRDVVHPSGRESYGYNLVTPFVVSDSGERILVNRGWIRTKTIKPQDRPWSKTEGEQTITGVVRMPEPKRSYGPTTDLRYKIWHYRDIEDMAEKTDCLPIFIDATTDHSIPGKIWGGQSILNVRNEHLSYIITWYSLSVCTAYMWYLRYGKAARL